MPSGAAWYGKRKWECLEQSGSERAHRLAAMCCLGLSFHANADGDSVLLLKELELTLLRREMLGGTEVVLQESKAADMNIS